VKNMSKEINGIIEFNKKEMEMLVKMAFCGDMVINGCHIGGDENYQKLLSKIYAKAYEMGMTNIVRKYINDEISIDNDKSEEYYGEYFGDFNESNFWEELPAKLADRDMLLKYGEKGIGKMNDEKRMDEFFELANKYGTEFEKNGVMNLVIK
jgi:hypothetical protein